MFHKVRLEMNEGLPLLHGDYTVVICRGQHILKFDR